MHRPRDFGGRQSPRDVISHLHFPRPRTLSGLAACPTCALQLPGDKKREVSITFVQVTACLTGPGMCRNPWGQ